MYFLANLTRCPFSWSMARLWCAENIVTMWGSCVSKKGTGKAEGMAVQILFMGSLAVMVQLLQPQWDQCKLWKPLEADTDVVVTVLSSALRWAEGGSSLCVWREQKIKHLAFGGVAYWPDRSDLSIAWVRSACRLCIRLCFAFDL